MTNYINRFINSLPYVWTQYSTLYMIWLVLSALFIFLYCKKHINEKLCVACFYVPVVICFLVFLNPIVYNEIMYRMNSTYGTERLTWIFPAKYILASGVIIIIGKFKKRLLRILAWCIVAMFIVNTGHTMWHGYDYKIVKNVNLEHMDQEVIDVAEIILEDEEENKKLVLATPEISTKLRRYSGKISLLWYDFLTPYNKDMRDDMRGYNNYLCMNPDKIELDTIIKHIEKYGANYIVFEKNVVDMNSMLMYGYELKGCTEKKEIYRKIDLNRIGQINESTI